MAKEVIVKVRCLTRSAGALSFQPGDVIEVTRDVAKELVAGGAAQVVKEPAAEPEASEGDKTPAG